MAGCSLCGVVAHRVPFLLRPPGAATWRPHRLLIGSTCGLDGRQALLGLSHFWEWSVAQGRYLLACTLSMQRCSCTSVSLCCRPPQAMVFALENADAAGDVVEVLEEALTLPETAPATKLARLYLVNDILANATAPVRNASRWVPAY